jgi:hypothetical protein
VIVGGLLLGTLLTLYVIPTAYVLMVGRRGVAAESPQAAGGAPAHSTPSARRPD